MKKSKLHLLMIEPDVRAAAVYAAALENAQYEVVTVTTAQDAVTAADERQPDIVLLELQLVAHGGIEFLYEFRSYDDWREVPVIILSHVAPSTFEASRDLLYKRLGVIEYLYKPRTSLRSLINAVERNCPTVAREVV